MNFHYYRPGFDPYAVRIDAHSHHRASDFWKYMGFTGNLCAALECNWLASCRPYYKVYPAFAEALLKLRLSCTLEELALPDLIVSLRFVEGQEIVAGQQAILAMLVGSAASSLLSTIHIIRTPSGAEYIGATTVACNETPLDSYNREIAVREFIPSDTGLHDTGTNEDLGAAILRLACSVALLAKDSEFLERDVLAKHRRQYAETGDQKYVEKAHKRGIVGWHLGRTFETIPHFRRPHLGLRWTGKGRTIPRIVPVKGSVVHRSRASKVPTGYTLPNGRDIEPDDEHYRTETIS